MAFSVSSGGHLGFFLHNGHQGSPPTCVRWFLKTLYPYLTACKVLKSCHKVHDFYKYWHIPSPLTCASTWRRVRCVWLETACTCKWASTSIKTTSLCSASYVGCQRGTARVCCWAPCCNGMQNRLNSVQHVCLLNNTELPLTTSTSERWMLLVKAFF